MCYLELFLFKTFKFVSLNFFNLTLKCSCILFKHFCGNTAGIRIKVA